MWALLDVNVLIALLDENHTNHTAASGWLAGHIEQGWASCPLTQNGCIRILSQPSYPNSLSVTEAVERLRMAASTRYHRFLPDDISLLDETLVDSARLTNPRQLTDAYLLALAVAHGARLVTLDRNLSLTSIRDAGEESIVVI